MRLGSFGSFASLLALTVVLSACPDDPTPAVVGHGPIAPGISAPLGEPLPTATPEQLATFARGQAVARRRFERSDGLGPAFNVVSCGACHEKPTLGGGAGLYRNFTLGGQVTPDGAFVFGSSAGNESGVVRVYHYGPGYDARPAVPATTTTLAQRNPIPFFGVGLLAELSDHEIEQREDPDDRDHDGISGRANHDRGFIGRFGVKAQTASIEGFIRGPLMNHAGITSNPLSEEQRARLPVDSSVHPTASVWDLVVSRAYAQVAAPDGPLTDDDAAPDPELSTDDLFDLVSFAMLLAAPAVEEPDAQAVRGRDHFDALHCGSCHTPRLVGPRGPLPVYSDLLLHDMGPDLADGLVMKLAKGTEFRTQPLWGIAATGPYLHDGRASTLEAAILAHGGESQASRDAFAALDASARADVVAFLLSLGGRAQVTAGMLPPGASVPAVGAYGGPAHALSASEEADFVVGRALFDRDRGADEGLGQPRFNGDSCRACHFDPVIGGSGPRDVNVMRHGIRTADGAFVPPPTGTILHKQTVFVREAVIAQAQANVFEHRQTPHLFGLGLIDTIPVDAILANADPYDLLTPDGISGKASWTDGGRLGRFGWKAQVPSLEEFVRDAMGAELGMTMSYRVGFTFGRIFDNDDIPEPELAESDAAAMTSYLRLLGPPPRTPSDDPAAALRGESVFAEVGCASCHTPTLTGTLGPVPLYSDLLLHEVLAPGQPGIEEASAGQTEFRTAPLWGLARTAPYLHTGEADTLEQAIEAHAGESLASVDAYHALSDADRAALLAFLKTL